MLRPCALRLMSEKSVGATGRSPLHLNKILDPRFRGDDNQENLDHDHTQLITNTYLRPAYAHRINPGMRWWGSA